MEFTEKIRQTILKGIPNSEVQIVNPLHDGVHLEAIVVCPSFGSLSLLKQHQMVMDLLKDHFEGSLHALSLKTYTPEQWQACVKGEADGIRTKNHSRNH